MIAHEPWFTLAKAGLILNTFGALFLVFGSNKTLDVLTEFVDTIVPTYGTYGQGNAIPKIKDLAQKFKTTKTKAICINYIGYVLFILGFILQIF
jgi:hypothetical protein